MFRVFSNWGLALSTPFVLRQALREYPLFFKVKIYSGTDNFQTTLRQLERYIYFNARVKEREREGERERRGEMRGERDITGRAAKGRCKRGVRVCACVAT